ncbi:MAG: DUF4190 domain-containing protein [Verrucomicrobiota bacterium]
MQTTESPYTSAPKTSGLAIASLITGLTCISPLAVVFGHMAMSGIKKSSGQLTGSGLALAGMILGYIGLLVTIVSVIAMVAVGGTAWKMGSDVAKCMMLQIKIDEAVSEYQAEKALEPGAALDVEAIKLKLGGAAALKCPAGGTITIHEVVPAAGEPACECSDKKHARK